MRSVTVLLSCVFLPAVVVGQDGPCQNGFLSEPFGSCLEGSTYVSCPGNTVDSIVWSNGQVGIANDGLTPGIHSWQAYADGEVVQTRTFEVGQRAWAISGLNSYWMNSGFTISGWTEVDGGACTSNFHGLCCGPVDTLTYVRLVQDGVVELNPEACVGCDELPCFGHMIWFSGVPTGHTYTVRLYDLACGNVIDLQAMLVAHSCDNLALSIEEVGTEPDAMTGEVHLLEAVPDATEPLPLQGTVTGTARLLRGLDGFEQVGDVFNGVASASWTDLDTGYYRVSFIPDAQCNHVTQVVHVSTSTAIGPETQAPGAALQVGLTADRDRITVRTAQGTATHVEMLDALGRTVPIRKLADGSYHIGATAPGTYLLRAMVSGSMATAKFIVP